MKIRVILAILPLVLSACSPAANDTKASKPAPYSYNFPGPNCTTNTQTSDTLAGICAKLEDHILNNRCAYGERAARFGEYNCLAVLTGLISVHDGDHPSQADPAPNVYAYDMTVDTCRTGHHVFPSKADFCEGLRSDWLNANCARSQRAEMARSSGCK